MNIHPESGNWLLLSLTLLMSVTLRANATVAETWHQRLQPFLKQHCLECHQGSEPSGGLDLVNQPTDLTDREAERRWTLVHDRIATGEMPPDGQPSIELSVRDASLNVLSAALTESSLTHNSVALRRLNRHEYENTVRDLFDVYVDVRDILPIDTSTEGFDNVGEGLAISAEAMEAYLRAADVTLDAVFGSAGPPKSIRHVTRLTDQKTHDGKPFLEAHYGRMFRVTDEGLVIFQSGYCPTNLVNFARLRPSAGTYRGTIRVRAVQSQDPVTLRIYGGDTIVGRREKHLVGYYDVAPDRWTTIRFEDRLVEDGGTYQPKCYGTKDTRRDADTYPEPGIEIGEITIEGPVDPWPPRSRLLLLGDADLQQGTAEDADRILSRFLPRALRRPVQPREVLPYSSLAASAIDRGRSFEEALRLGLKAVLCSPEFLFLDESGDDRIDPHAVASRLSYFLWSSAPDDTLRNLSDTGSGELHRQVERMLADAKAQRFIENFTGQWLDLREIDFTSPEAKLYPEFDELLKISMVEETRLFFREILEHDLSVMNFVDSDFAILNERLARHYGVDGVRGQQFRRVVLPPDSVRGGLMTMGSILKVTANGTNTSPVIRGAWIQDRLLGQPSPPPPANIPAVEPDIRGTTTLREQLAAHRNVESCAMCHRFIDPPGFALENFDAIGGWRDNYRTLGEGRRPVLQRSPHTYAWISYRIGPPVDASGQTASGDSFQNIRDFKRLLKKQRTEIITGLTKKLFTYALGRQLVFADRPEVATTVRKLIDGRDGLRHMVHAVVQSELFQRP